MNKQKNIKEYDKLMRELDTILSEKRISYAQFATKRGIQTVAFYNRYKIYGFRLEDMVEFVAFAKVLKPNMIKCLKCSKEFVPKAKSVKRAFCNECREAMQKKRTDNDSLKFHYPKWVSDILDENVKLLVEQEYHIDEDTALLMSRASSSSEAKLIRSARWQTPNRYYNDMYNMQQLSTRH